MPIAADDQKRAESSQATGLGNSKSGSAGSGNSEFDSSEFDSSEFGNADLGNSDLGNSDFGNYGVAPFVDLSRYHQPGYDAGGSKLAMLVWWLVQATVFPLTLHTAHGIRCYLLRLFGANIGQHVIIRPTARFTYPWNITIGDHS